jgi:hypothetical protein
VLGGTKTQIEAIRPNLQRSRMSHRLLEVCEPFPVHISCHEPSEVTYLSFDLSNKAEGCAKYSPLIIARLG